MALAVLTSLAIAWLMTRTSIPADAGRPAGLIPPDQTPAPHVWFAPAWTRTAIQRYIPAGHSANIRTSAGRPVGPVVG